MLRILLLAFTVILASCNSDMKDAFDDVGDVVEGVPRKDINTSQLGVNAFFNDGRFGTIPAQYQEIGGNLNRRYVRVLFAWNDQIQPTPTSPLNLSFYDAILASLPESMDALVILTDVPTWMRNPANWQNGDPRQTFVTKWVDPVVSRYASRTGVVGWQIWNEPNMPGRPGNDAMGFSDPDLYLDLIARAHGTIREHTSSQRILNAATTAINQNFPQTLRYNEQLIEGGLEQFIDVFALHYYGRQFENIIRPNGVGEFVRSLGKRVWITESGAQGTTEQRAYGEQVWPYLNEQFGNVDRIYVYQMYEATPPNTTYGLRNLSSVSDLYQLLNQ